MKHRKVWIKKLKRFGKRIAAICMAAVVMTTMGGCGKSLADTALKDIDVDKYVTLGDYKNLAVEIPEAVAVDEEQVDYYVQYYLSNNASEVSTDTAITDRAIRMGDTVNLDFAGVMEEIESDGLSGENYDLTIGSGSFIPGFEEALVGMMPGDVEDISLVFPEEYWNTEMAGLPVVFTVTINHIVSDEMMNLKAASIGIEGVSTVDELRDYVRTSISQTNESTYEANLNDALTEALVNSSIFSELPNGLIQKYETFMRTNIESQSQYYGMSSEDFVTTYYGTDLETLVSEYSVVTLKQYLAVQAVANREGLNVSDDELNAKLSENATLYGYESVEEYIGNFSTEDFRDSMMYDNVIDFLKNNTNAQVTATVVD